MKHFFTLLFVLVLSQICFALNCNLCSESINGKYWKNGDRVYCEACYERTRIRCSSCSAIIDGKYVKDGMNNYCVPCAEQKLIPRCYMCDAKIMSKYFEHKSKKICSNCYYEKLAPKCSNCKTIIDGKYLLVENKKYCLTCYDLYIIPKCYVCGAKMPKGGLSSSGLPFIFCKSCYEKYNHCRSCGIPVKKASNNEINFPLCANCNFNTIYSDLQVQNIFAKVRGTAQKTLGMSIKFDDKRIYLKSSAELKQIASALNLSTKEPLGLCNPEYLFNLLFRQTIYIQRGMTDEMAFDTLAHEFAHAWKNIHKNPSGKNEGELSFEEGFCEWVSYKCLLSAGYTERAKRKLENKDNIYGNGLRKMLKLEKQLGGKDKLLKHVIEHSSF